MFEPPAIRQVLDRLGPDTDLRLAADCHACLAIALRNLHRADEADKSLAQAKKLLEKLGEQAGPQERDVNSSTLKTEPGAK